MENKKGADHHSWKNGKQPIVDKIRRSKKFHTKWKQPILLKYGKKCFVCETNKDIQVHHYDDRMEEIVDRFMPKVERLITKFEESFILENVINYHIIKSIKGIPVCHSCHREIHKIEKEKNKYLNLEDMRDLKDLILSSQKSKD